MNKHYVINALWTCIDGPVSYKHTTTRKREAISNAAVLFNEVRGFRNVAYRHWLASSNPRSLVDTKWIQLPTVSYVVDGKVQWTATAPNLTQIVPAR